MIEKLYWIQYNLKKTVIYLPLARTKIKSVTTIRVSSGKWEKDIESVERETVLERLIYVTSTKMKYGTENIAVQKISQTRR